MRKIASFSMGLTSTLNAIKQRLKDKGIIVESIELLKGSTIYIVATLDKANSLFGEGVLEKDGKGTKLLSKEFGHGEVIEIRSGNGKNLQSSIARKVL